MASGDGQKTLGAPLTASLFVQTVGAIDPRGGAVTLPSPAQYVATWVVWGVLGLVAGLGDRAARFASQMSVLILTTMVVGGPFGQKAVAFFNSVARLYPTNPKGATQ